MIQIGADFGGTKIEAAALNPEGTFLARIRAWLNGRDLNADLPHGEKRAAEEVIGLMRDGDEQARASFHRYSDRLARALATVCNIVVPDTIVFGGGLSNVSELFTALPATIGSYVFSDTWATKLVAARWGDSSGVQGAARLWPIQ